MKLHLLSICGFFLPNTISRDIFSVFIRQMLKLGKYLLNLLGFRYEFIEFLAPIYSVPAKLNCFVDEKMTKTEVFL